MTLEKCTLLVRHLPASLCAEDIEEMLKTFGAVSVYPMTKNPRMKHMAFAAFDNPAAAQSALQNLHQLELLGRRLIVEYALESNIPAAAKSKLSQWLNYPFSPKLMYRYPAPTPPIVSNIAKALVEVPKFYWQVLHLMNKMNLPAPFEPFLQTQPLLRNRGSEPVDSEEESELESETELTDPILDAPIKMDGIKRTRTRKMGSKKAKIQSMLGHDKIPSDAMNVVPEIVNPSEVFELPNPQASKKIEFKLRPGGVAEAELPKSMTNESGSFGTFAGTPSEVPESVGESSRPEEKTGNFITEKELRENRMQGQGITLLPAFKNYDAGTPSDRLYLKNLAKQVEEKDLEFIYGRYVEQASDEERNRFNIRLMKEGRMKGQAFVTMPDVDKARAALTDTLGYMLHGKPIVVVSFDISITMFTVLAKAGIGGAFV